MYPYLFIYVFSALSGYLVRARRHSRVMAVVFCAFLVLFTGTRVEVGCDYGSYLNRFNYSDYGMGWLDALRAGEVGFHAVSVFVHEFGYSFSALLFICASIYVVCLGRFATLARLPMAFLALSFPILVVQLGMSGIRQAVAIGFLMLALVNFVNQRRVLTGIWIIVAMQFHASAVIFLPMVFLVGRQVSIKQLVIGMVLLGPVATFLLQDRLEVYNDRYIDEIYGEMVAGGAWLRYILMLIPFLLFLWKRRLVMANYPRHAELFRLFTYISIVILPIGLVSNVALHRLVFYVLPVSTLALLCVAESIFSRNSERFVVAIPFAVYGAYIAVWFMASDHAAACYIPYQSWLM